MLSRRKALLETHLLLDDRSGQETYNMWVILCRTKLCRYSTQLNLGKTTTLSCQAEMA